MMLTRAQFFTTILAALAVNYDAIPWTPVLCILYLVVMAGALLAVMHTPSHKEPPSGDDWQNEETRFGGGR